MYLGHRIWSHLIFMPISFFISACTMQARIIDLGSAAPSVVYAWTKPYVYFGSKFQTITPTVTGTIDSFSVSPSLPPGLSLHPTTGVISGNPTQFTSSQTYTITATTSSGTLTNTLTFEVAAYFVVDTTTDAADAGAADFECLTAAGQCSIRAAFTQAANLGSINYLSIVEIPAGTYTVSSSLTIGSRMNMSGAGASATIISGGGAVGRVLVVNSSTSTDISLTKFSIQNGFSNGIGFTSGIGLHALVAQNLTLTDCDISNNNINNTGGAFSILGIGAYLSANTATIDNCTFNNNSLTTGSAATMRGVGLYNLSTTTIKNSTFSGNNSAGHAGSLEGIAINAHAFGVGSIQIENSTFTSNSATNGNVVYTQGEVLTITKSQFSNNTGANVIRSSPSISTMTLTLSDLTLTSNTVTGASINLTSQAHTGSITNTYINSSAFRSIYMQAPIIGLAIKNTTIYSTSTSNDIDVTTSTIGSLTLENVTVQHNNAAGVGLNLAASIIASFTLTVKNSIFDRSAGSACAVAGAGSYTTGGYNVARDASCSFLSGGSGDLTSTNPSLSAPANNGGTTFTMAIGTGSPAYNLVPTGSCTLTTDQRGSTRPNAGACDAGAYEY